MRRRRHADDAVQTMLFEAELQGHPGRLGGEASAPPRRMELEPDLGPVGARPAIQLVKTDSTDPAPRRLVDGRPRPEAVRMPLLQTALVKSRDSSRRHMSLAPDGRVAEQALKLDAVTLAPRPQEQPVGSYFSPSVHVGRAALQSAAAAERVRRRRRSQAWRIEHSALTPAHTPRLV